MGGHAIGETLLANVGAGPYQRGGAGQRTRAHRRGIAKAASGLASTRFIRVLPTAIFAPSQHSPHLNIVETLWRKLKYEWLAPQDYCDPQNLFCQVRLALAAVGTSLFIRFAPFALGLT